MILKFGTAKIDNDIGKTKGTTNFANKAVLMRIIAVYPLYLKHCGKHHDHYGMQEALAFARRDNSHQAHIT